MKAIKGEARYGNQTYPLNCLDELFGNDPNDRERIERGFDKYGLLKRGLEVTRTERQAVPGFCDAAVVWHNGDWSAYVEFGGAA